MRRAVAVVSAFALSAALATPAGSQTANNGAVWAAVAHTATAAIRRVCGLETDGACSQAATDSVLARITTYVTGVWATCGASDACSWLQVARALGLEYPVPLAQGGTTVNCDFFSNTPECGAGGANGGGGGGATEDGYNCGELEWKLDVDGNLIVPSIRLGTGGPMVRYQEIFDEAGSGGTGGAIRATSADGVALRRVHTTNSVYEPRRWMGCWRVQTTGIDQTTKSYSCRGVAFWDGSIKRTANSGGAAVNPTVYNFTKDCPEDASGGTFHFYVHGGVTDNPNCIWHAPDGNTPYMGYFYNLETTVPMASLGEWPRNAAGQNVYPGYSVCPLDAEFIRRLTDRLIDKVDDEPGYEGPPNVEVKPEDVQTGDEVPTVDDLRDDVVDPPTDQPEPYPTPTPGPAEGGDGPDYDPTVTNPDLVPEDIDWWPDLPSIEVDLGSPTCPTYQLTLAGWWDEPFIIDSHCPIIEDNRAAISLLMLSMFGLMSFFIVLRA